VKSGPIGFAVCPHATGRDELNGVSWNLTLIVSERVDTVQLWLQLLLFLTLFDRASLYEITWETN
jgi:hypothetical protein